MLVLHDNLLLRVRQSLAGQPQPFSSSLVTEVVCDITSFGTRCVSLHVTEAEREPMLALELEELVLSVLLRLLQTLAQVAERIDSTLTICLQQDMVAPLN